MLDKNQLFDSLAAHCLAENRLSAEPTLLERTKKIFQKAGKRIFTTEHRAELKKLGIASAIESITHEEMNRGVLKSRDLTTLSNCSNAFVAGLSAELMALRAPLRAFAVAAHYPDHAFPSAGNKRTKSQCHVCGYARGTLEAEYCSADLLNCLRQTGMHGRANEIYAAAKTLEWFATLPSLKPTPEQIERFEQMLSVIAEAPANTTCNSLTKDLNKILGGDKDSRLYVIETLGYCGVLNTPEGEPLLDKWVNRRDILEHPAKFNEAESPACFWKREFGFAGVRFRELFPMISLPRSLDVRV